MLTVTINEKSAKGKALLRFAEELNANEKDIKIRKFRKLTDEEMALPGKPVSEEQLDEWLNRPDHSKGMSIDQVRKYLDKKHGKAKK